MQQVEIYAHIKGAIATWVVTKTDGQQIRKKGRIDQFIGILQSSSDSCKFRRIGKYPEGLIDFAIGEQPGTFKAVFLVPESVRILSFFGDELLVPFPETVFFMTSVNGRIVDSKVHAKHGENLCHYPFGNVYDDGKICWGQNKLPNILHLEDMKKVPALFFGGDTNNDLYRPGKNVIKKKEFTMQRGLVNALLPLEVFPKDWLVSCHKTMSSMVDDYLN